MGANQIVFEHHSKQPVLLQVVRRQPRGEL
jgi:hypothetical protein